MMKALSVFMAWVVFLNPAYAARMDAFDSAAAPQAPDSRSQTIKEQSVRIPAGSVVEVCLTSDEKLKGRMGAVSDDGIILQHAKAGQIAERKIVFADITSIKAVHKLSTGGKALFVLLGIVVGMMAVGLAVAAH